ncbi:MAG: CbtA family protein, partial [Pseudorhodobacter sp.]|nr:CbtA family protein [Frankiaceae bacterium]
AQRSRPYLVPLLDGLVGACTAALVSRSLSDRAAPTRQLSIAGVLMATVALTFVLPSDPDPLTVPAGLLWTFRLLSLGTLLLLWVGLSATYGLLVLRARRTAG